MKPGRDFSDYIRDMVEMAEAAQTFVVGMDYNEFLADLKTQLAVPQ